MDELKTIIQKDIDKTFKNFKSEKDSFKRFLNFIDLDSLYDLCNYLEIKIPPISIYNTKLLREIDKYVKQSFFSDYESCKEALNFTQELLKNIINFFEKNVTTCDYSRELQEGLNLDEELNLAISFLEKCDRNFIEVLTLTSKEHKLLLSEEVVEDNENCGITFSSFLNYSPYIAIKNFSNISTSSTIVHECVHAFEEKQSKQYSLKKRFHRIRSRMLEIPSYYYELCFFKYLEDNNLYVTDIPALRRDFDIYLPVTAKKWNDYFENKTSFSTKDYYKIQENYDFDIETIYGKAIAYYLYSLNDKEKADYLLDRLRIESLTKNIVQSIKNCNVDLEDIMNLGSSKKLIIKNWR